MLVIFEEEYLKDLYHKGKCSEKKHRFQPEIIKRYQQRIDLLISVPGPETLYQYNSLHFELLTGDRAGLYSIRINNKYRIEFSLEKEDEESLLTICNIVELSNHYQ